MVRSLIALAIVLAPQIALANTDWKCLTDCQKAGYQWGYCKKLCSY